MGKAACSAAAHDKAHLLRHCIGGKCQYKDNKKQNLFHRYFESFFTNECCPCWGFSLQTYEKKVFFVPFEY
jgi:hypothetical protein